MRRRGSAADLTDELGFLENLEVTGASISKSQALDPRL